GVSGASVEARLHPGGTIRIKISNRAFDPTLAVTAESIPGAEQPAEEKVRLVARGEDQSEGYEIQSVPPGHWRLEAKGGKNLNEDVKNELNSLGYVFGRRSSSAKVAAYEGAGAQSEVEVRARAMAEVTLALP